MFITLPTFYYSSSSDCRKKARKDSEEHFISTKGGLLASNVEGLGGDFYRPRTRETKASYEMILSFVQQMLGDQVSGVGNIPRLGMLCSWAGYVVLVSLDWVCSYGTGLGM